MVAHVERIKVSRHRVELILSRAHHLLHGIEVERSVAMKAVSTAGLTMESAVATTPAATAAIGIRAATTAATESERETTHDGE